MNRTRRSLLGAGGSLLAASAFAGCLDDLDLAEREYDTGYAALFSLWDWAEQVSGETMAFENPVGTGESGHGWSPPGDLTRDIADAGVFVYLDTPEFAWAQDIASTLEADYDDVIVVDGFAGLDDQLLEWDHETGSGGHDHENDTETHEDGEHDHEDEEHSHEDGHEHEDENHSEDDGHEHEDENHSEDDGHEHEDENHSEDDGHEHEDENHSEDDGHEHEDENHSEDDGHEHGDDGHDHDHDRSSFDPHAWLDPVLAQDILENIVDGLVEAHPDEEETFRANADEYVDVLEDVDQQFEALIEDADRRTAVFAGHDSFTYLEDRYGFELHTPVGVSPNEEPSQSEISETIDHIDENGIDTILYDAFDAPEGQHPPLVGTLLDGSDATDAMPLATASGTLASWEEQGWGYREQMEEINIPAFREALDAQ
ncbi:zinc ABC transporter substrate-binding protein [Haloterrigena sp. SYSU A121-1]|uniref:Zinc ABC transporter substrate-binding protein n=1 Tax=Haloterrigena gelatinilytica TaxID=2741724 RepID=A0A8J8GMJ5_9EURY|nr:metal ABC transporter substrate-binding protein [Haloterrigena gelatinilytica]NUB91905.1 zinc ABC transporter substrate-binding protein [Haloterrigena gelatinilytica]